MENLSMLYNILLYLAFLLPFVGFIGAGSGTSADPYIVTNMDELNDVRNELDAVYEQANDIDAGAETDNSGGSYWNGGSGWAPIGNGFPFFNGTYDGAGFEITGMFIDRSTSDAVGLIGRQESGTRVRNLVMANCDMTNSGGPCGAIGQARVADYIFEEIKSSGSFISSSNAGGVISRAEGDSGSTNVIRRCTSSGTVRSNVTGSSTDGAGGVIGRATGFCSVENCYADGTIESNNVGGGVTGYHAGDATADKSYAACTFTDLSGGSASYLGLVIGRNNFGGAVSDCFGDEDVAGFSTTDGGTAKTTSEMQDVATYTDTATAGLTNPWDFVGNPNDDTANNDYWDIDTGYPFLTAFATGSVTLSGNDISHTTSLDQGAFQTITLSGNGLEHTTQLDQGDIPITLSSNELQHGVQLDQSNIPITLFMNGLLHTQLLDQTNIPITLTGNELQHSTSLDQSSITIEVIPNELSHSTTLDQTTVSGFGVLQPNSLESSQQLDQSSITILLSTNDISNTTTLEGATLQVTVRPSDLEHTVSLDQGFFQAIELTPDELSHSVDLQTATLIIEGDATKVNLVAEELYEITLSAEKIYRMVLKSDKQYTILTETNEVIE